MARVTAGLRWPPDTPPLVRKSYIGASVKIDKSFDNKFITNMARPINATFTEKYKRMEKK